MESQSDVSFPCPQCGHDVNAGAKLCGHCWAKLESRFGEGVTVTTVASGGVGLGFADRRFMLGGIGFVLGGLLGFLTRPSALLIGQLPFSIVLSRGGNLRGLDQVLVPWHRLPSTR